MQRTVIETKKVVRKVIPEGKMLNQYLKIKKIGQGPYSKIKLMKNIDNGLYYAMKKYNLFILKKKNKLLKRQKNQATYTTAAAQVLNEVKILKQVNHPNIAKLIQILEDHQEQKLYLFLEYCELGDIAEWSPKNERFTLNKKIPNTQCLTKLFLQITAGIEYLHTNNIVHRDIKPQNILLDKGLSVKIIDFGRAVKIQSPEQKLKGSEGTYHFMAPQMLSQKFKEGYDGKKCDMWSLGVTFFAILFEILPFYHQLLIKLFQQIQNGIYKFPQKHKKQFDCYIRIIQNLLKVNPFQRWNIEQLKSNLLKLI